MFLRRSGSVRIFFPSHFVGLSDLGQKTGSEWTPVCLRPRHAMQSECMRTTYPIGDADAGGWAVGSSMFPIARSVCDSLGVISHPRSLLVILEEQGMPPQGPDCRPHPACGDLWERLASWCLVGHSPDVQPMFKLCSLCVWRREGALEIGLFLEGFKSSDGFLLLSRSISAFTPARRSRVDPRCGPDHGGLLARVVRLGRCRILGMTSFSLTFCFLLHTL